jgi:hypothetical protein
VKSCFHFGCLEHWGKAGAMAPSAHTPHLLNFVAFGAGRPTRTTTLRMAASGRIHKVHGIVPDHRSHTRAEPRASVPTDREPQTSSAQSRSSSILPRTPAGNPPPAHVRFPKRQSPLATATVPVATRQRGPRRAEGSRARGTSATAPVPGHGSREPCEPDQCPAHQTPPPLSCT